MTVPGASAIADWFPRGYEVDAVTWGRRHRSVVVLLMLHVVGLAAFGAVRGYPISHVALELTPVVGLALLASGLHGRTHQAMAATLGLLLCSAVLVHFSDGSIEAHFHFLVMVGVVTIYQSWVPFALAIGFVLVHHATVGVLAPDAVYNHGGAIRRPWLWAAIHAGFVGASALTSLRLWKHVELERAEAQRIAAAQREHATRLQDAAAINDTIVQDLVAARFAYDLDEHVLVREALDVSLARAQQLVAALIDGDAAIRQPGGLRRLAVAGESG